VLDPQQSTLLQRREFPGIGDDEKPFQAVVPRAGAGPATGRLQDQSRSGTRLMGHNVSHELRAYSLMRGPPFDGVMSTTVLPHASSWPQATSGRLLCVGLDPDLAACRPEFGRSVRTAASLPTAASSMRPRTWAAPTAANRLLQRAG